MLSEDDGDIGPLVLLEDKHSDSPLTFQSASA